MAAAIRRRHGGAVTAICQTAWTDWLQAPMQHPLDAVEAGLVKVAGVQLGDHHSHLLHAQRARQLQRRESSWRDVNTLNWPMQRGWRCGGSPFMRTKQAQHRIACVWGRRNGHPLNHPPGHAPVSGRPQQRCLAPPARIQPQSRRASHPQSAERRPPAGVDLELQDGGLVSQQACSVFPTGTRPQRKAQQVASLRIPKPASAPPFPVDTHLCRPSDHVGHKVSVAWRIQQRHVAAWRLKPAGWAGESGQQRLW